MSPGPFVLIPIGISSFLSFVVFIIGTECFHVNTFSKNFSIFYGFRINNQDSGDGSNGEQQPERETVGRTDIRGRTGSPGDAVYIPDGICYNTLRLRGEASGSFRRGRFSAGNQVEIRLQVRVDN